MKILFYISNIRGGGAARVMTNIANAMAMENEIYFVTNFPDEHEYELNEKITRYNLEFIESKANSFKKNFCRITALRSVIKEISPSICMSFMGENNVRLIIASKGLKTKTIISVRNDPSKEYPSSKFRRMTDLIYRKANGIVFQTEDAKKYFSKDVQNNSQIIFNQVDSQFYQSNNRIGNYILACGRLSRQKDYPMMLEAFKLVLEEFPNEKLYIYGDGKLNDELEQYSKKIGINSSVYFMGYSNNMVENYADAKFLIVTSIYEGMPNVILEALASSLPVVSTDCPCGGPRMVIENGINGFLCPVGDAKTFANRMVYLLKNEKELIAMKENAHISANKFTGEHIIDDWKKYIERVINYGTG